MVIDPAQATGARRGDLPGAFKPQLATAVAGPPRGDGWLHEIKYDGYRLIVRLDRGAVSLLTRTGKDWSRRFAAVAKACKQLPFKSALLDGEIVAQRRDGGTDFQHLQNHLRNGVAAKLVLFLFDMPYCDGYDLTRTPLTQRKQLLRSRMMDAHLANVQYSDHVRGQGARVMEHVCRMGLEGIVSKRADAGYEQRRSRTWVKSKCLKRQEFIVVGYTRPTGSRIGFGALLLAVYEGESLVYCGKVGTGFDDRTLERLHAQLQSLRRQTSPLTNSSIEARGVRWVMPRMVVEVSFIEWTDGGRLRQPTFQGVREDKPAAEVVREGVAPMPTEDRAMNRSAKRRGFSKDDAVTVAGVILSNPDRVMYPDQGVSKHDLAKYYEMIAPRMLAHLRHRPLSIVRCPRGRGKDCFYQKYVTEALPESVQGIKVSEGKGSALYIAVDDVESIIALVQMSTLELHAWSAREDRLDRPDLLIFDLDPGPDVDWPLVVEAARHVRGLLEELDMRCFVKSTGGKGLHVVAPLQRRAGWEEVKSFAHGVASRMTQIAPERYTDNVRKAERGQRIYVDYLRNSRGATAIVPYSTRARAGAAVATPLRWDELSSDIAENTYNITTLPHRLASLSADPWKGFDDTRQSITAGRLSALRSA